MNTSTPRPRDIAQLGAQPSTLRRDVTRWALASGHRVYFDALTVILAAKSEYGVPVNRWTEDDVWRLWWIDLSGWCMRRGLRTPDGLSATLASLLAYLDQTDGFASGSDSYEDLDIAMAATGATWRGHNPASAS